MKLNILCLDTTCIKMIHSKHPNLQYFLFYGAAKELYQVDPDTVKPALCTKFHLPAMLLS